MTGTICSMVSPTEAAPCWFHHLLPRHRGKRPGLVNLNEPYHEGEPGLTVKMETATVKITKVLEDLWRRALGRLVDVGPAVLEWRRRPRLGNMCQDG